ncbi:Pullanase-associated domain-containing protein [Rubrivivax sp. A210]|uniref:pullulanase-associated domain-containing protein n=1 Tax=Rubrivivax sp. A210 TaxID=2772301 RepID=UPI001917DF0B|nr:pullulanase-associated domain-containing protein [Rubrivivax sp. A210]CAD5366238.1 Pullanase-associated domain-containing protein [Rubrivivax sp. A210]
MSFQRHSLARLLAAAGLALAVSAPALAAPPEGKIVINYNRCDKNYEGWGAHLWKYPSFPLEGIEWGKPMPPSGTNDFGVFWQVDLAAFGSTGSVNYIIHKGDIKEQGGKDMKFDGKTKREAWVLGGDSKIYFSAEDAAKARGEKPCP